MAEAQPKEETFYDVLKVERKSTIAEIVSAYHAAKNAFSRDSVATYSLFSSEEAKEVLEKLEEAYLTLSNVDKKREYDQALVNRASGGSMPAMTDLDRQNFPQLISKEREALAQANSPTPNTTLGPTAPMTPIVLSSDHPITGALLREVREKRGMSIDDVARITKIPVKFVRAIEMDDTVGLPARVYLQGFVKNLAATYRLNVRTTLDGYLTHLDKLLQPSP